MTLFNRRLTAYLSAAILGLTILTLVKLVALPQAAVTLTLNPQGCGGGSLDVNTTPYLSGNPHNHVAFIYPQNHKKVNLTVTVPGPVHYLRLVPCRALSQIILYGMAVSQGNQTITFNPAVLSGWSRYELAVTTAPTGDQALLITSQKPDGYMVQAYAGAALGPRNPIGYLFGSNQRFTLAQLIGALAISLPLLYMTLTGLKNGPILVWSGVGLGLYGFGVYRLIPFLVTWTKPVTYGRDGIISFGQFTGYALPAEAAVFWLALLAPAVVFGLGKLFLDGKHAQT